MDLIGLCQCEVWGGPRGCIVGGRNFHDASLSSQQLNPLIGRVVLAMQEAFDKCVHPLVEHCWERVVIEAVGAVGHIIEIRAASLLQHRVRWRESIAIRLCSLIRW